MVRITVSLLTLGLVTLISAQGTQFITGPCTSDADCAAGCCGFNSGKCAGPIIAQERDGGCGFGDASPNDRAAVALGFSGAVGNGQSQANAGNSNANAGASAAGAAQNSNPPAGMGNGSGGTGNAATGNTGAANSGAAANSNNGATAGGNGGATGNGAQFITGPCTSDADCASGCCGFNSGKCAGPVVAQERDGGCGFGSGQPNDNAAQAFRAGQRRGLQYQWE